MPSKSSPNPVLPLPLYQATNMTEASFVQAKANQAAWQQIKAFPNWPKQALLLIGAHGAGKTHLCQIWCDDLQKRNAPFILIDAKAINEETIETSLGQHLPMAIDNADRLDAKLLMELYNHQIGHGLGLLMSASLPLWQWPYQSAEMQSRLIATHNVTIQPPDDDLITAILAKQFADRQMAISIATIRFFILRIERSYENMQKLVHDFDLFALEQARPYSRPLAEAFLQTLSQKT